VNIVPGGNGNLDLRAQGSGAVNFNDNPGSGTSGVQFYSGGATPVPVAAITGGGVLLLKHEQISSFLVLVPWGLSCSALRSLALLYSIQAV
jgi:hypothetical protein